jgi:hypothetical protein
MENRDIVGKLKALLNMTTANGCTEAEAENAMEKAQALMLQHNLSVASINNDTPETPQGIGMIDHTELSGYSWRSMLAHILAKNTLCRVIVSPSTKTWHIFGTYDNVRAVMEMYNWLTVALESQALTDFKAYRNQGGIEHGRSWKTGYFNGAITAINNRLKKPMDDFKTGTGHSIVIYNDKAVSDAIHRVYPRLGHSTSRSYGGYAGREAGMRAGNGINLTPSRKLSSGSLALGMG